MGIVYTCIGFFETCDGILFQQDFNSTSCVFCIPLVRASWDRKHDMSWIKITYTITNFERFYLSHVLILFLCINPYFRGSLVRKIPTSFKI